MSVNLWSIKYVLKAEDGAITVDWIVLTASIVALGFAATAFIWQETGNLTGMIAEFVDGQKVVSIFTDEELAED